MENPTTLGFVAINEKGVVNLQLPCCPDRLPRDNRKYLSPEANRRVRNLYTLHRYVGRLFVKALGKLVDILKKLNEMAGFSPNEEIELFEAIIQCSPWGDQKPEIWKTIKDTAYQLAQGDQKPKIRL